MNYRATVFTQTIPATSDNIAKLVTFFSSKNLFPNVYNELMEGQTSFSSVLELKRMDGSFVIKFGFNRVDFFRIKQNPSMDIGSIEDFCELSKECLNDILKLFPQKISRIALFVSGVLKEIPQQKMENVYLKLFNESPFIETKSLVEWNNRQVMRINLNIASSCELVNFVLNISRGELTLNDNGQITISNRMVIEIDINTYQHNKNERFGYGEVVAFWDEAASLYNKKLIEMEDYIWEK